MRTILLTVLFLGFLFQVKAQDSSQYRIKSSTLGSSGSSQTITTSKGDYKVSQSIGQSSVIGTHSRNGYYLRQGYQQPLSGLKVTKTSSSILEAKVYPNPFNRELGITFSNAPKEAITVLIYDVEARLIYRQEFAPNHILELQIEDISSGAYFLKVSSGEKRFDTKLIKI